MRITGIICTIGILIVINSCTSEKLTDNSLTLEEYMNSGMPDPYRIWKSNDFALANAVCENIKSSRPKCLPVKESRKSGMIFDRMVSLDNLDFLRNKNLNTIEKLSLAGD